MARLNLNFWTEPMQQRLRGYKAHLIGSSEDSPEACIEDDLPVEPTDEHPANLVSSLCTDGLHRPAIDIDVPCVQIPSSTPGHCHLYFPTVSMSADVYFDLLDTLADVGIVGPGFARHSRRRGASWLRLPGVKKEPREGSCADDS